MDRKAIKQQRLLLMDEIDVIGERHNYHCETEGCPDCQRLAEIGMALDRLSESKFTPPAELTWRAWKQLKARDWTNKEIIKHYGVTQIDYYEFVKLNRKAEKPKGERKMVAIEEQKSADQSSELTVPAYEKLKEEQLTDKAIRKMFSMDHNQMHKFKKAHNLIGKHDLRKQSQEPTASAQSHEKAKDEPEVAEVKEATEKPAEKDIREGGQWYLPKNAVTQDGSLNEDIIAKIKAELKQAIKERNDWKLKAELAEDAVSNMKASVEEVKAEKNAPLEQELLEAEEDRHFWRKEAGERLNANKHLQEQISELQNVAAEAHFDLQEAKKEIERQNQLLENQHQLEKFAVDLMKKYTALFDRVANE